MSKSKIISDAISSHIEANKKWDNGELEQDMKHAKVYANSTDSKINLKYTSTPKDISYQSLGL